MTRYHRPGKQYIEYDGYKFHKRAHPDAYEIAIAAARETGLGKLLDLGAGSGFSSYRLAQAGFQVIAVDINTEQFVPTQIPCIKADMNGPVPAENGSIDTVVALEIIEHLENPKAFLREIGRVLKPGGSLILSTPNIVSVQSKTRFLFKNEFRLFFNAAYRVRDSFCDEATGHISPILPWLLRIFLNDAGLDEQKRWYTRYLGFRTRYFAQTCIVKAIRIPDTDHLPEQ
jgi:2-polyprenyl-3-methyl-5-hydroxy-6-metoxy-1,4-benzoquinol methylase